MKNCAARLWQVMTECSFKKWRNMNINYTTQGEQEGCACKKTWWCTKASWGGSSAAEGSGSDVWKDGMLGQRQMEALLSILPCMTAYTIHSFFTLLMFFRLLNKFSKHKVARNSCHITPSCVNYAGTKRLWLCPLPAMRWTGGEGMLRLANKKLMMWYQRYLSAMLM